MEIRVKRGNENHQVHQKYSRKEIITIYYSNFGEIMKTI